MTVQVLTTGGTIGSTVDVTGSVSVSLAGPSVVPAGVAVREVARRHSFALSTPELLDLVTQILAESTQYEGSVATHGTDTMEETTYLLDLLTPDEQQWSMAVRSRAAPSRNDASLCGRIWSRLQASC